ARDLAVPTVLIPPSPGVASALGMLMTDVKHEFVATRRQTMSTLTPEVLETLFARFAAEGDARLAREAVPESSRHMLRTVALRSPGQPPGPGVPRPAGPLAPADLERLRDQFHAEHERAYGYAAPGDAVELVNVRLTAVGVSPKPQRPALPEGGRDASAAIK